MPGSQLSVCNVIRANLISVESEYCAKYPDFEAEIREYVPILSMSAVSKSNIIKYLERGFAISNKLQLSVCSCVRADLIPVVSEYCA